MIFNFTQLLDRQQREYNLRYFKLKFTVSINLLYFDYFINLSLYTFHYI